LPTSNKLSAFLDEKFILRNGAHQRLANEISQETINTLAALLDEQAQWLQKRSLAFGEIEAQANVGMTLAKQKKIQETFESLSKLRALVIKEFYLELP
jgi:hypothetical protein